jgi:hypothetical protein
MSAQIIAKVNRYFHDELIEILSLQTGLSADQLRASVHFSILAPFYQVQFRLQQKNSALVTYRMAKVAAAAGVSRHLIDYFNKASQYQGVINMTAVLHNGDYSKIEQMICEKFGISEDQSHRILMMSTCATLAMLGESIRDKKLRLEGFQDMVNVKLPLYADALSSGLSFPAEHWANKSAELHNQRFHSEARRKRSKEKKPRFSLSFKWVFILLLSLGLAGAIYAYS